MSDLPSRYAIVLNGPPGSGKDFAAKLLVPFINQEYPWVQARHMKFAKPLKEAVHKLLAIPHSPEEMEGDKKDEKTRLFYGMSPREAYIAMSEDFAKKHFGTDVFGRLAVRQMQFAANTNCAVFSDGGFVEELLPVIDFVGIKHFLIIEISASRNGKVLTFANDSRDYVAASLRMKLHDERGPATASKLNVISIPNDFDREIFTLLATGAAKKFFDKL
jgi:hypothetical protein